MEPFEWNVIHEGQLLDAMVGHKPVGVNKYFQMACICEKLAENIQKDVNSSRVWQHLETMYNLEALDENESLPFPNSEKEFALPENEFGTLITKKDEDKKSMQKGRETPKSLKETKKDDLTPNNRAKETNGSSVQRRDSKDSNSKTPVNTKKEAKPTSDKGKQVKGKSNNGSTPKEDSKGGKVGKDDTPKPAKRSTRGSLKPDDSGSSGKSSPVTVSTPTQKRMRRI